MGVAHGVAGERAASDARPEGERGRRIRRRPAHVASQVPGRHRNGRLGDGVVGDHAAPYPLACPGPYHVSQSRLECVEARHVFTRSH